MICGFGCCRPHFYKLLRTIVSRTGINCNPHSEIPWPDEVWLFAGSRPLMRLAMKLLLTMSMASALIIGTSAVAGAPSPHGGATFALPRTTMPALTTRTQSINTPVSTTTPLQQTQKTGQPNASCGSLNAPNTPGNAATAPGSAFNPDGKAGTVYAGQQPQNSVNPVSVSQYDAACLHQSH